MLRFQRGFSMIELMIAIVIMSILVVMGAPSFTSYLANSKVRASAESLLAGLQRARGDAVQKNAGVEFLLLQSTTIPISANAAVASSLSGTNWMIRNAIPSPGTPAPSDFIEGKQGSEGDSTQQVAISATAGSVVFGGLGGASTNATFDFSNPTAGACATAGPVRCLRVVVSTGGRIFMCDPAVTVASDSRRCP